MAGVCSVTWNLWVAMLAGVLLSWVTDGEGRRILWAYAKDRFGVLNDGDETGLKE